MNHIYKVIFNKSTGAFMAVAEYAKGQGKKSNRSRGVLFMLPTYPNKKSCADFKILKLTFLSSSVLLGLSTSLQVMAENPDTYFHVNDGSNSGGDVSTNLGKVNESAGATAEGAITAGVDTSATGKDSIAIGSQTNIKKPNDNTRATGLRSVAIGSDTQATKEDAYALGSGSRALGQNSVALGTGSSANKKETIAIGNNSISDGTQSITIGSDLTTSGSYGISIGSNIQDNKIKSLGYAGVAIGSGGANVGAQANGESSVAIGGGNKNSSGLDGALATATNSVALGSGATASEASAVAMGSQSVADRTALTGVTAQATGLIDNTVYAASGISDSDKLAIESTVKGSLGALSIGNTNATRQITNVAAGRDDSDAVNVAQLKSLANSPLTFVGNTNDNSNINGTQQLLGSSLKIIGSEVQVTGLSNDASLTPTTGDYSAQNVQTVVTNGQMQIQLAENPDFNSLILTNSNNTTTTLKTTSDGLDIGGDKITNVAAGTNPNDAVNISQLNTTNNNVSKGINIAADIGTKDNVQLGKTITYASTDNSVITTVSDNNIDFKVNPENVDLTYKANGANSQNISLHNGLDFLNGTNTTAEVDTDGRIKYNVITEELNTSNGVVDLSKSDAPASATSIADAINNSGFTATVGTTGTGTNTGVVSAQKITNTDTVTLRSGDNMVLDQSGSVFTYSVSDAPVFKTVTATNSATIGDTAGNNTILTSTADGLDVGGDKITNVEAGTNPNDAVNVSQLNTTNNNVAKGLNIAAEYGSDDKVQLGETITYTSTDRNIVTTVSDNQIDYGLANKIEVGTANPVIINGDKGTINGLNNTTFDANNFISGQAATEDQLAQVANQADNAAKGWNLSVNGDTSTTTNIKSTDTVDIANADDNIEVTKTGNNVEVGLANNIMVNSVTAGNTTLDNNGITLKNGSNTPVSLTNQGLNNGNNIITNVSSGLNGKDLSDINNTSTEWNNAATVGDLTKVESTVTNVTENLNNVYEVIGGQDINGNAVNGDGDLLKNESGTNLTAKEALITYNVSDGATYQTNSVISAVHNMNEEGIKYFHTNDDSPGTQIPKEGKSVYDSNAGGKYSTAIGYQANVNNEAQNGIAIGHGATVNAVNGIAIGTGNVVNGENSGAIGDPSTIDANNAYSIGNNNVVSTDANNTFVLGNEVTTNVENSVALGNKTTITAGNQVGTVNAQADGTTMGNTTTAGDTGVVNSATVAGVTYYEFAGATANGAVSVGASGSERRIQNVAAGEVSATSTDAINGSQLNMTNQALTDLGYRLTQDINDVEEGANAGISSAMAMAALPQAYISGKSMVTGGMASYNGEGAVAVGLSTLSDNGRWVFKISGSADTEGNAGGAVGAGFHF